MNKTKKITTVALFCSLAYIAMFMTRFLPPILTAFPFLKYDPKDVIIVIGGFIYGPFSAFLISFIVSMIEMVTVSGTHIIGCIMNIASTCAFACVASAVYKRFRSIKGAAAGLLTGLVCNVATMLVLNYFLTPLYMQGVSREAIISLLLPAIMPFNVIKCTLNSALTLLLYKPFVRILRRSGIVESRSLDTKSANISVVVSAIVLFAMCTVAILLLN